MTITSNVTIVILFFLYLYYIYDNNMNLYFNSYVLDGIPAGRWDPDKPVFGCTHELWVRWQMGTGGGSKKSPKPDLHSTLTMNSSQMHYQVGTILNMHSEVVPKYQV